MAEDPALPLTDVQAVLGHAQLATTQIYLTPRAEDVIRRVLAHHGEQVRQARQRAAAAAGGRVPSRDAAGAVRDGQLVTARLEEARTAATPAPVQLLRQTRQAAWAAARAAFPPRPAAARLAGHPAWAGSRCWAAGPGAVRACSNPGSQRWRFRGARLAIDLAR